MPLKEVGPAQLIKSTPILFLRYNPAISFNFLPTNRYPASTVLDGGEMSPNYFLKYRDYFNKFFVTEDDNLQSLSLLLFYLPFPFLKPMIFFPWSLKAPAYLLIFNVEKRYSRLLEELHEKGYIENFRQVEDDTVAVKLSKKGSGYFLSTINSNKFSTFCSSESSFFTFTKY